MRVMATALALGVMVCTFSCGKIGELRKSKGREFAVQYFVEGDSERALDATEAVIAAGNPNAEIYLIRVMIFNAEADFENALEACEKGLAIAESGAEGALGSTLSPDIDYDLREMRSNLLQILEEPFEAARELEEMLADDPEDASLLNDLAWSLATDPEASFRDGPRAVELATKAAELVKWKDFAVVDTVAAAYAESGDFAKAVEYQEKAISLLADSAFESGAKKRLELYQVGKNYIENPRDEQLRRLREN